MISIAWLQQILNRIAAPSADATDNAQMRDVVGSKTDAAVTAVGTTKSLVGYVKGLIGEMSKRKTPVIVRAGVDCTSNPNGVVNISGSGVLTGIRAVLYPTDQAYASSVTLTITLDGVEIAEDMVFVSKGSYATSNAIYSESIPFYHQFDSSLCISADVTYDPNGYNYGEVYVTYTVDE